MNRPRAASAALLLSLTLLTACGAAPLPTPTLVPTSLPAVVATATLPAPPTAAAPPASPTMAAMPASVTPDLAMASPTAFAPPAITPTTLPAAAATPGTATTAVCGAYTIRQHVTTVLNTGRVTSVTVERPAGTVARTLTADTSQGGMVGIRRVQCAALTGDGTPDLIVTTFTGGADCCTVYDVVALTADMPTLLHWNAGTGGIRAFAQLDPGGAAAIVGTDARLAGVGDLPVYATPAIPIVFSYRGGRYVAATADYPAVVRADQADALAGIAGCNGDEICERSGALHVYADGVRLGTPDAALATIRGAVTPAVYTWLQGVRTAAGAALAK